MNDLKQAFAEIPGPENLSSTTALWHAGRERRQRQKKARLGVVLAAACLAMVSSLTLLAHGPEGSEPRQLVTMAPTTR